MTRIKGINVKARAVQDRVEKDVRGYAFSDCCPSFAPGWEVGRYDDPDPCPWKTDLQLCWQTCYWTGQVPDAGHYNDWFDSCSNINNDWRDFCAIPDNG